MERANLWRGLRLGSRQYLHLYTLVATDLNKTVKDLKEMVDEDLSWEETIRENGGVVPPPPQPATTKASDATSTAAANGESTSSDVIAEQVAKDDDDIDAEESTASKALQEADGDSLMSEEKPAEVDQATPNSDAAPLTEPGTPLDDDSKDDTPLDDAPLDDVAKDDTAKDEP